MAISEYVVLVLVGIMMVGGAFFGARFIELPRAARVLLAIGIATGVLAAIVAARM